MISSPSWTEECDVGSNLLQRQTILELARRVEACIEQAYARAHHRDIQPLCFEVVEELSQRHVCDLEAVPELVDNDFSICTLIFTCGRCDRLTEAKEGQS